MNEVGDGVIATPAIADGNLFIRTRSKYCASAAKSNESSQRRDCNVAPRRGAFLSNVQRTQ
jgi:hypothetical protein